MRKVFLSSTSRDLNDYRDAAYEAIEGLDGYHCVRMENFGARDWKADEFCRGRVAECQVFVGIVGHRYGDCPSESEQSYTEREYEAAVAAGMSRLMFIAPDDFPMSNDLREPDKKWWRQQAFRERVVGDERICTLFKSSDELAWKVVQAVHNWGQENNVVQEEPIDTQTSRQHIIHPYPLERNFAGRFVERREISEWWLDRAEPILAIIGIGGVGKSAMVWAWLQHDFYGQRLLGSSPELYVSKGKSPDVAREELLWSQHSLYLASRESETTADEPDMLVNVPVFWWSFYERGADFEAFLEWFTTGVLQEEPSELPTASEQVERVLQELIQSQCLLVLDGFERELVAYRRCRQQYRDETSMNWELSDYRRCVIPEAGIFLQRLAASRPASRVIVTSQFLPAELEGLDSKPLPGCRKLALKGLAPSEALSFMRAQGVKGSDAQIRGLCEVFEFHPLSLRAISGRIVRDLNQPGDVAAVPISVATETIAEEYRGISIVYNETPSDLRMFLGHMSTLDLPVSYQELQEVVAENELFEIYEDLAVAVQTAIELGLVTRDMQTNQYGMHAVVRAYMRSVFGQGSPRLRDTSGIE